MDVECVVDCGNGTLHYHLLVAKVQEHAIDVLPVVYTKSDPRVTACSAWAAAEQHAQQRTILLRIPMITELLEVLLGFSIRITGNCTNGLSLTLPADTFKISKTIPAVVAWDKLYSAARCRTGDLQHSLKRPEHMLDLMGAAT